MLADVASYKERGAGAAPGVMMREPANVLLVGNEPEQLHTQATVLKHFWRISVSSTEEFPDLLGGADVVVLSHSLSDKDRQPLVEHINAFAPQMLIVKMNGSDTGPHNGVDAGVDLHHGPGALVSTVYELLTERGIPSKGWLHAEFELAPGIH